MVDWIPWSDDLACNIPMIDDQHRELFRRFNILGDAVWDGKGKEAVGELLDFLADYTVKHFGDEEALMATYKYPALAAHKKAHEDLVNEVQTFIQTYKTQEVNSSLIISVLNKLGDWTRGHIRGMDQEYSRYLRPKLDNL